MGGGWRERVGRTPPVTRHPSPAKILAKLLLTQGEFYGTLGVQQVPFSLTKEGPTHVYQTEAKPQSWRRRGRVRRSPRSAAVSQPLGHAQVREGFRKAYFDLLDDEQRGHVHHISLQRWQGAPDSGRWQHQSNLAVPTSMPAPMIMPMMIEEDEEEMAQVA